MLAAQLTGIRALEVNPVHPPPAPGPGQVLVAVRAVGVCGSDVHNYVEGGIGARPVDYPFIPGHEAAGDVVAIGAGVTRVRPGDRIAIEPAISCGDCDQCRAGRANTCRSIQFLSSAGELQGCMCEQVVIPEANCFPVPDTLSYEAAAVAEPLSIAIYSVARSIPMTADTRIGILGAGPIGLCTLLAARAAGGKRIYVTDPIAPRREAARALGAIWAGDPHADDVVAAIRQREPLELDVVFECCGRQEALDQAAELLKPGGKLMITGIPEGTRVSFDISRLRRNELTLYNVRRQCDCMERAIDMIASGTIDVEPLITHRLPLRETKRAFDLVADYADGVIKAVVTHDAGE